MIRITKTEKWKDVFFLNLKPTAKLVFIYIYENCDDAGFFDLNFDKTANDIGISREDVALSMKSLEKTFIVSSDSEKLWLRKFLLHQNRLPLDLKTDEGNYIKLQIENNMHKFKDLKEFENIVDNTRKKSRSKSANDFIKPSVDDIVNHFINEPDWSFITRQEILELYQYYEGVGWKVGKKNMVDWKLAFIGCFRRNYSKFQRPNVNGTNGNVRNGNKFAGQQTRLEMIIEGSNEINGFDYNTLKK